MGKSVLCACLPTFRLLVVKVGTLTSSLRQRYGSSNSRSKESKQTSKYESANSQSVDKKPEFIKMSDQDRLVRALRPAENTLADDDKEIAVERRVDVSCIPVAAWVPLVEEMS